MSSEYNDLWADTFSLPDFIQAITLITEAT